MIEIYRTEDRATSRVEDMGPGSWVRLSAPTLEEVDEVARNFGLERDDLLAAIDPEEKARVEQEGDTLMVLVDVPSAREDLEERARNTVPLCIILTKNNVVTICTERFALLDDFSSGKVRDFSTWRHSRFACTILLRLGLFYQQVLVDIDRRRLELEGRMDGWISEGDLFSLHGLESSLVYLSTSLQGNANVLGRLRRLERLLCHQGLDELLEDAIVEHQQAIEMAQIYRNVIDGTRDLMSSVMDLRLNDVMRRLTVITVVLSVPTIVSGFYGMNVDARWMPLSDFAHGFAIICMLTALVCVVLLALLKHRRVF
ncbi:magnesium transporter CorA family protein [Olsenella urininfantis]|uniref:magnesium transporter CorA family protein n=1 Tax=Olsenella urininfantis TaxID=1871033 RepID=UPI0009874133|nr:magnesium transporter CorA family protein [Olsenella urininfantis]